MFALKQISLMALLIASAYAAPQLDLEENAKNINTEDYINVRDHQYKCILCRAVGRSANILRCCGIPGTLRDNTPALRGRVAHSKGVGISRHCFLHCFEVSNTLGKSVF